MPGKSNNHSWLDDAERRFQQILTFPAGWDSNGCSAPEKRLVDVGRRLLRECTAADPNLPRPYSNATPSGGVSFAWESETRHFEIEVEAADRVTWYYQDAAAGIEAEDEVPPAEAIGFIVDRAARVYEAIAEPLTTERA